MGDQEKFGLNEKGNQTSKRTKAKIIWGFGLSFILALSVTYIAFYSIGNLVGKVESLSEPNRKLYLFNSLIADIYELDKLNQAYSLMTNVPDTLTDYNRKLSDIRNRMMELQVLSDSLERVQLDTVYVGLGELEKISSALRDIKQSWFQQNFSERALRRVERKMQQQQLLEQLATYNGLKMPVSGDSAKLNIIRDTLYFGRPLPAVEKEEVEKKGFLSNILGIFKSEDKKQKAIVKRPDPIKIPEIKPEYSTYFSAAKLDTSTILAQFDTLSRDSILNAVKTIFNRLGQEEKRFQMQFVEYEMKLINENAAIISNIQTILNGLEADALRNAEAQNAAAYELTRDSSRILLILVIIGMAGSLAFVSSIFTEIKKGQRYRIQLEEAKERSEQLAKAKQDFLANMSHEIRNPLHAILGFTHQLKTTKLDDRQEEYVHLVDFASQTLSSLVDDILDYSKLDAGKITIVKSAFDPHRFFNTLKATHLSKACEKNLGLRWEVDIAEDVYLVADSLRLGQIINNLVGNAIKFTEYGEVAFQVSLRKKESEQVLEMKVVDTGIGISEDLIDQIFEKFNQGDTSITRKFGGTGLGLSIVKGLLEIQGGTIRITSAEGEGTSVYFDLPVNISAKPADGQPTDQDKVATPSYEDLLVGYKILIVDDDPMSLQFARLILEKNGAQVISKASGKLALEEIKSINFDLALVDVQMPEVSGYDVVDYLKNLADQQNRELPVLAITANVFAKEKQNMTQRGFDGVITKPYKEEQVLTRMAVSLSIDFERGVTSEEDKDASYDALFDLTDLERFCMGDEGLLQETVENFIEETTNNLQAITLAYQTRDGVQMKAIAHQLSSRLGQLKINEAAQLAAAIELQLKENIHANVNGKVAALVSSAEEALHAIKESVLR
ncbi:ATP-binding protein [Penaeicola halotolerans]|uniref:ATP-binding protein n=1 Tax=Penaeicola halotolerans TaxID=2793196 RepID=UPI001CF89016|nr:ATP-binding protein [Penaeicola halotolerans]